MNTNRTLSLCVLGLVASCATSPPPGSREEAVNNAWERLCKSGYCEGYSARIVERTERTLTVRINGNIRYMTYSVTGNPGSYVVQMQPTANRGRTEP